MIAAVTVADTAAVQVVEEASRLLPERLLDDATYDRLRDLAVRHGVSMEGEVR
jgi:hypothetical protein